MGFGVYIGAIAGMFLGSLFAPALFGTSVPDIVNGFVSGTLLGAVIGGVIEFGIELKTKLEGENG